MDGDAFHHGGGPPSTHLVEYYQGMPDYGTSQDAFRENSGSEGGGIGSSGDCSGIENPNMSSSCSGLTHGNRGTVSIWAGDLDAYMDENFLRQAVSASGWGNDITRIKVVRDHYSGTHAGYGFLDAASPEAAQRVIATGSGMPIPGTNRCWRLNLGRNTAASSVVSIGAESNVYVGNLDPTVTDYQLMTVFRPRYPSVRHAKVVCNEFGQSKGFGFVRFSDAEDAERAVTEMNGYMFSSKPIRLSPAAGRTRSNLSHSHTYGSRHYSMTNVLYPHLSPHGAPTNKRPRQLMSPDDPNNTTIFIGGTANHITEDLLWREFSTFGDLEAVRVPVNKTNFAFVRFKSRECAQRAKDEVARTHFASLNPNKPVRVEWASEQIPLSRSVIQTRPRMVYTGATGSNVYGNAPVEEPAGSGAIAVHPSTSAVHPQMFESGATRLQPNLTSENTSAAMSCPQFKKELAGRDRLNRDDSNAHAAAVVSTGDTEPPSKRVAIGRPEYAAPPQPVPRESCESSRPVMPSSIQCPKSDYGQKESNNEPTTEGPPAMQFSWLNTSTQTASNSQ